MKEQWRQQMQQKMADYKRPAPEVSWDALDNALAQSKPQAKILPMWMRRVAAAVAVLVLVTAGYLALHHEEPAVINNKMEAVADRLEDRLKMKDERYEKTKDARAQLQACTEVSQEDRLKMKDERYEKTNHISHFSSLISQDTVAIPVEQHEDNTAEDRLKMKDERYEKTDHISHFSSLISQDARRQSASASDSRLVASLYMSGGSKDYMTSTISTGLYGYFYVHDKSNGTIYGMFPPTDEETVTSEETEKGNTVSEYIYEIEVTENKVTHHPPIRFGLTLSYRLDDRWSLESGLVYTRLSSDRSYTTITSSGKIPMQEEQRLSYLGIPLKVNHQLWANRHFGIYVSAGGMIEKMVKGSRLTMENGTERKEDVSISPLQFSVNGAVGAQYNLSNLMSVYAEPGVGYYFDNGSEVPTYYQEKPFSFNLNLGLRFNIK